MLQADVGFQWASLGALSDSNLVDGELISDQALGLAIGAGAGVRLLYLTAGVRFRFGLLDTAQLWSVGLEGNLRIPRGAFEPFFLVGAGYAQAGAFEGEDQVFALGNKVGELTARGLDVRLGGGFDYFITPVFSAGIRADAELLLLRRPASIEIEDGSSVYEEDGSSVGVSASGIASLGLHF